MRSDRESALANETFAVYCERLGIARDLINADDDHTRLGILDRRIQMIRYFMPRLADALAQEGISLEPEDIAAECQICLNTLLSTNGVSPYVCLYGTLPNDIRLDEDTTCSADQELLLPFFQHQLVRNRAIQSFQEALLQGRLQRAKLGRARTENNQAFQVGQLVDIFRKPPKKDLVGWRGPAVIVSLSGEGLVTVRWQGTYLDMPVRQVRPHLPLIMPRQKNERLKGPRPEPAQEPVPQVVQLVWALEAAGVEAHDGEPLMNSSAWCTLASITQSLPPGGGLLHTAGVDGHGVVRLSRDAERDDAQTLRLAAQAAQHLFVNHIAGVLLMHGRRFIPTVKNVEKTHVVWWIGDRMTDYQHYTGVGKWIVDVFKIIGEENMKHFHSLRAIVIYEASSESPPLERMLQQEPAEEALSPGPRVREPVSEQPVTQEGSEDSDSEPSTRIVDNVSTIPDDVMLSMKTCSVNFSQYLLGPAPPVQRVHYLDPCECQTFAFDVSTDNLLSDSKFWLAAEKELRPLSPDELHSHRKAVKEAMLKELRSWIEHKTGTPVKVHDYINRTGLKPLPARWVIEWKRKEGVLVIKARLCLKGFAEQNQHTLHTAAPTATRLGHRMVVLTSVLRGWELWSLDVSTAFLQGWSFSELKESGYERQPCAFKAPGNTLDLLAELDPSFKTASKQPDMFCLELDKAAYGLKDAPLLWNLRFAKFILSVGFVRSPHDSCIYCLYEKGVLTCELSLHVDDTLCTGETHALERLHKQMEKPFGTIKAAKNKFRHFGIEMERLKDGSVVMDQAFYLAQLKTIEIDRTRGDGRTVETAASEKECADFRSLVAGVAWVGVTNPAAQAGASMYQHFLPNPLIRHVQMLNRFVEQLKAEYVPLTYQSGLKLSQCKLLVTTDSSLGNADKYSQGGHLVWLCQDEPGKAGGKMLLLSNRSGRSKRVASSTMSAETLALSGGVEEASLLQTWLHELRNPGLTARDLLSVAPELLTPMDCGTDCNDLYEVLVKPAAPAPTNKSLTLYLSALRSDKETQRIRAWLWFDTRDMLANSLTKIEADGSLAWQDLRAVMLRGHWQPARLWRWNSLNKPPGASVQDRTNSSQATVKQVHYINIFTDDDEDQSDS